MMVDTDKIITVGDIARRLGVRSHTVSSWRGRDFYDAFPEPVARVGVNVDLFLIADIDAWARRTGRLGYRAGQLYDSRGYEVGTKRRAS